MSDEKRCDCCKRYWYCDDLVSGLCPNCLDFLATKNQMSIEQDQKIKELEHRLSNCIEPKFEYGQQVFYIANGHILSKWFYECESKDGIIISRYLHLQGEMVYRRKPKDLVFATEEEAKAKLEDLKNG